jgi:2,4-didehydro-3-deoxy-L-rhamnonate hydrolase
MKLFSYKNGNDNTQCGVVLKEKAYSLFPHFHSILELIKKYPDYFGVIEKLCNEERLKPIENIFDLQFAPPIVSPNKLICVAGNYIDHVKEGGINPDKSPEIKQAPWMFLVPPSTVMVGHGSRVIYPPKANCIDYEGELAVVISKKAKDVKEKDANDYIAGYTIFNDVSERKPFMIEEVEKPRDLSFWYKKSFDTFGPIGPYLIPANHCDPNKLCIQSYVNDELKQSCQTSEMIFNIPKLIAFLSSFMTLEPGDIISTGTPSGVGAATGDYLKKGDRMKITIEGLGSLENTIY